jgi:small ligand-binding sensory domain FIST
VRWSSAASAAPRLAAAVNEAAATVRASLDGVAPDLVVAFVSAHHESEYRLLPSLVRGALGNGRLFGCSAGAVIGGGRELEEQPGLSLTAAVLPGVSMTPFHLEEPALPHLPADASPSFVLIPDPFTFDVDELLHHLDTGWPGSTVIGGLASGGRSPGGNALFLDAAVYRRGVVGLALAGDVAVDTIVAQGCRPIGEPMFVTRSERNVIQELDGRRAGVVLQEIYNRASSDDQALFRHSLHLGIVMREDRQEYRHGDFLIRNVMGIDGKSGALVVGALVHTGMVVQFHLRDARTSAADLEELLGRYRGKPAGALLFSCLGRGKHLYGEPDHDTNAFHRHAGDVPLGGFFCNGEIGPVHGTTFLHGFTSAFGLFRPRGPTT